MFDINYLNKYKMKLYPFKLWTICLLAISIIFSVLIGAHSGFSHQQSKAINTRWKSTPLSQESCIAKASQALLESGFGRNSTFTDGQTVFASTQDSQLLGGIRCIDSKDIVFFVVTGTSQSETRPAVEELKLNFSE